jgi:hypothetical protein
MPSRRLHHLSADKLDSSKYAIMRTNAGVDGRSNLPHHFASITSCSVLLRVIPASMLTPLWSQTPPGARCFPVFASPWAWKWTVVGTRLNVRVRASELPANTGISVAFPDERLWRNLRFWSASESPCVRTAQLSLERQWTISFLSLAADDLPRVHLKPLPAALLLASV